MKFKYREGEHQDSIWAEAKVTIRLELTYVVYAIALQLDTSRKPTKWSKLRIEKSIKDFIHLYGDGEMYDDYENRSEHEFVDQAKAILAEFYPHLKNALQTGKLK